MNRNTLTLPQKSMIALSVALAICLVLLGGLFLFVDQAMKRLGFDTLDGIGFRQEQINLLSWQSLAICYVVFTLLLFWALSAPVVGRYLLLTVTILLFAGCLFTEWMTIHVMEVSVSEYMESMKQQQKTRPMLGRQP